MDYLEKYWRILFAMYRSTKPIKAYFTNCIINFHFETLWMSLLNLYQTSNNWLKYKNSDFNISVEATRWAEPKEALCVSSAWNLERRTALWGPIL